jgi:hypothetical protein
VHEADPDLLAGLLSLADVDALLTSSAIRTPAVRVARDGSVLPDAAFTRTGVTVAGRPMTGLVDQPKLLALFGDGATVVLQGVHRYWPPLTDLVADLELELGHPCQVNAYLTPPGAQGFAVHVDSHDVFVFQTHGTKLWEIHHAEGERPCEIHPGCRVDDVLMRPGLCLYLPTGTPHAARTQDDASLHVTLGINQRTWGDLVRRAVRPLLDSLDDGHLPAANLDTAEALVAGLRARLDALADDVRRLDAADVVDSATDRFLTTRNPRLRGGVLGELAAQQLTAETRLRRRPGQPCVLRPHGDRLRLLLGDRELDVPGWLRPAVEELRPGRELTPADLPITVESAVVLCRRLLREGLLEAT